MKAYIIGGGSSVTPQHYEILKRRQDGDIVCTNFTFNFITPDVLCWLDTDIYTNNPQAVDNLKCKKFSRFNIHQEGKDITICELTNKFDPNATIKQPIYSRYGKKPSFTGVFAISIALALGYDEIYLLGYDGGEIKEVSQGS